MTKKGKTLIAAQNNAIKANYIEVKIDKEGSDRDETVNRIIIKCSKLVQKEYKT